MKDEDSEVRQTVAEALEKIWQPENDNEKAWYLVGKQAWSDSVMLGKPAIDPLIYVLRDRRSQNWFEEKAAEALGRIGDKRAVDSLIYSLKDGYPEVRYNATEALGRIGEPKQSLHLFLFWRAKIHGIVKMQQELLER